MLSSYSISISSIYLLLTTNNNRIRKLRLSYRYPYSQLIVIPFLIVILSILSTLSVVQSNPFPIPIPQESIQNQTTGIIGPGPLEPPNAPAPVPSINLQPNDNIALIQPSENSTHNHKDHGSSTNDGSSSTSLNAPHSESLPDGFDDKAMQRAFVVMAGLGLILVAYFGIKFVCIKKRSNSSMPITSQGPSKSKFSSNSNSSSGRYGLLESTEMDILDSIDEEDVENDWRDDDDSDEAESNTLFDLRSHRRT